MPLRLNLGVSRKVGLPDYGSVGASCNVEVELDSALIDRDLDAFHDRVRDVYVAAHQAVHDELARLQGTAQVTREAPVPSPSPSSNGHAGRNGHAGGNGHSARPPAGRTGPRRPATEKQVRAIVTIAGRQHADLDALLCEFDVDRPGDLSIHQASELIDSLNATARS